MATSVTNLLTERLNVRVFACQGHGNHDHQNFFFNEASSQLLDNPLMRCNQLAIKEQFEKEIQSCTRIKYRFALDKQEIEKRTGREKGRTWREGGWRQEIASLLNALTSLASIMLLMI